MTVFPSQMLNFKSAMFAGCLCAGVGSLAAGSNVAPFHLENDAAMAKMMEAMRIKPSADVDRDFVGMMVPHHQGAIDMAQAILRHGRNEQIRRLAQEIIVNQQQEIVVMRLAVGDPLPPSIASPTESLGGAAADVPRVHDDAHGMSKR